MDPDTFKQLKVVNQLRRLNKESRFSREKSSFRKLKKNYGILAYFGVSPYAPRMIYRHFGCSSIAITHEYAAWFFFRSMLANCKIACHIDRKVLFTKRLERVKSEPMIDELL